MMRLERRSATRMLVALLWGVGIVGCLYKVTAYSYTSAPALPQANQWPTGTTVSLATDRPTVLVTLHPRCVCSRATLEELGRSLAQISSPINLQILIYEVREAMPATQNDLTDQARSIPGASVRIDREGNEARRFGMSVSGHVALYASDGRLLFSGGITSSRGHVGDNAGRAALVALLSKRPPVTTKTPVFGCPIQDQT